MTAGRLNTKSRRPAWVAAPVATPIAALIATLLGASITTASAQSPPAPDDAGSYEVTVAPGDTLIGLSRRLLADPRGWRSIARLNGLRNPDYIVPGQVLRLPFGLMNTEIAAATVLRAHGTVTANAQAVRDNQTLAEGARLVTADDASATVRLVDGTLLRLRGGSTLQLEQSRKVPAAQATQSRVRLEQGRMEVEAQKQDSRSSGATGGRPGFRVGTPQGVLAVRGTEFRVAVQGSAADGVTRGEVLAGSVQFSAGGAAEMVNAGFGSVIATGAAGAAGVAGPAGAAGAATTLTPPGRPQQATPLLGTPDAAALAALPALHERLLVRIALPPAAALAGMAAWRVQVGAPGAAPAASPGSGTAPAASPGPASAAPPSPAATSARPADFDRLFADQQLTPGAELRIAGLDDGDYLLRLRGVDGRGLEGRDALHRFRLKARPEPPLPLQPAPGRTVIGNRAELKWADQPQAERYRVQLARDATFSEGVREWADQRATQLAIEPLAPGVYHWRVGSLRTVAGAEDRGPWGDTRSFEMRLPPPAPVVAPPAVGSNGVSLSWTLTPGQQVDVQLASDNGFAQPALNRRVATAGLTLPLPAPGRWFLRLRSIDADGFEGPWGGVQSFEVFNCVRDAAGECVKSGDQVLRLQ